VFEAMPNVRTGCFETVFEIIGEPMDIVTSIDDGSDCTKIGKSEL
jgi:hypothetical protein